MKNIKTASKANQHERVNDILLGPLERPALKWLVEKLPKWVTPNFLTAVGLIAAVVIFLSYWLTNVSENFLWLASGLNAGQFSAIKARGVYIFLPEI